MYGMEVSFKVSALKNKIFISWLVVVLVCIENLSSNVYQKAFTY